MRLCASLFATTVLSILMVAGVARGQEWEEPKDGVLTSKQLDGVLAYMEKKFERVKRLVEEQRARDGTKSPMSAPEAFAVITREQKNEEADVKASGLDPSELGWACKVVGDVSVQLDMKQLMAAEHAKQNKELDEKLAAAEKRKAEATAQRKAGRRVMTPEQLQAAKENAEGDVKVQQDNAAEQERLLKEAKGNLAEAEKTLKGASAEEKEGAEGGVASAKEAVKNVETALAEAKTALAAAKKRAANPDAPQSDEEKAAIDRELAEAETKAHQDVDSLKDNQGTLARMQKALAGQFDENLAKQPKKNVELVQSKWDRVKKLPLLCPLGAADEWAKVTGQKK